MMQKVKSAAALLSSLLILSACSKSDSNPPEYDWQSANYYVTDSLQRDGIVSIEIAGEYPQSTTPVTEAICDWLAANLSGEPLAPKATVADLVTATGDKLLDSVRDEADKMEPDFSYKIDYEFIRKFGPVYANDKVITMSFNSYSYTGGAHGNSSDLGQSFLIADGMMITYGNLFTASSEAKVMDLIRKGLEEQYFGKSLDSQLLIQQSELEFPANAPMIEEDGVTFRYQQYEIAPYSAGMPECTLSWAELAPYLTHLAKSLVPSGE